MLEMEYLNILINVSNLISVFRDQGKYKKVKKMNRRALKRKKKMLGMEYLNILISVGNLALMLQDQEKYKKVKKIN
jgi:hypothetical protein